MPPIMPKSLALMVSPLPVLGPTPDGHITKVVTG
jgi:hypothetical protein